MEQTKALDAYMLWFLSNDTSDWYQFAIDTVRGRVALLQDADTWAIHYSQFHNNLGWYKYTLDTLPNPDDSYTKSMWNDPDVESWPMIYRIAYLVHLMRTSTYEPSTMAEVKFVFSLVIKTVIDDCVRK